MPKLSFPPPVSKRGRAGLATALLAAFAAAHADEGMWTFDHAPVDLIRERTGVAITPQWLARLQGAAVQYGASGSFVSDAGLMLTNHHVALRCIEQLSTPGRDLAASGFNARDAAEEQRCPGGMARVLISTEDVTATIAAAVAPGRADEERTALRKAAIARIEGACGQATGLQCEVVELYSGALFQLHRYKEWTDVRLVFAPEYQAAFFGGDADNFVFPRFALDFALFRIYENDRPVRPEQYLRLATRPVQEGDAVFVAGHPGQTQRLMTLAQLTALRDTELPLQLASAQAQQALLHRFSARSPEARRQALDPLFGTENWLKAMRGEYAALRDAAVFTRKADDETALRKAYAAKGLAGDPWAEIERATAKRAARFKERWAVGYGYRTMFASAGRLVEAAYETRLPEDQRLSDYRDAALPALRRRLTADAPVYKDLEVARLAGQFEEAASLLGGDHPHVRAVLAGATPEAAAERLVRASHVDDVATRQRLLDGGVAAIEASDDPLILLARKVYPLRRALERFEEDEVDTPTRQAADRIGQARFALRGHGVPPDATGTLRLSFGKVAGYESNGIATPWKTTWGGWLARNDAFDGRAPFDLPPSIVGSRSVVDARVPLDFVSTADIIGGNSGSPVVNASGEWVGLIFDSNLEALGAAFVYSDDRARAIAVDARAIVEALEKVYRAPALAKELRGQR